MTNSDANLFGRHDFDIQDIPDYREMPEHFSQSSLPDGDKVLVMSYVKRQVWGEVFDCDTGLAKGTIFQELEKPFHGQGGCAK